jgi:hypothetical protein
LAWKCRLTDLLLHQIRPGRACCPGFFYRNGNRGCDATARNISESLRQFRNCAGSAERDDLVRHSIQQWPDMAVDLSVERKDYCMPSDPGEGGNDDIQENQTLPNLDIVCGGPSPH